jgi:hypothetical protein
MGWKDGAARRSSKKTCGVSTASPPTTYCQPNSKARQAITVSQLNGWNNPLHEREPLTFSLQELFST